MRRLFGVLVLILTIATTAEAGVAGPLAPGRVGGGSASFTVVVYSTSDMSGLVLQGTFPTSQGGLVMDATLRLSCTTSVDGGSPHESGVTVVAAGTGGDAANHGQNWTYDGGFAGRAIG